MRKEEEIEMGGECYRKGTRTEISLSKQEC